MVFFSFFFWIFFSLFIEFYHFFSCHICTNILCTSNAPKLFCGCRQPNTHWCVCVRGNRLCLCVLYINVSPYGVLIKPEECWFVKRKRKEKKKSNNNCRGLSSPKLPGGNDVPRHEALWRNQASWSETSQCCRLSRPYDASSTLVWSLRCPLLLGVGSAWCRCFGVGGGQPSAVLLNHHQLRSGHYLWLRV